jgi:oxygen-independent coproporphyrinogen-3 oxidase
MAGVYLSYPFCSQKCTYCNFASGVFPKELEPRYLRALTKHLLETDWDSRPDTVYWGGGTPSLIADDDWRAVMRAIPGKPWREATIEAAPGGLTKENIRMWADSGITRVSLGVQSFITRELSRTGRKHTAETVRAEVALLRENGIPNFNIDLISGLPGQTAESWSESLDWVEKLGAQHVSIYMLEVDEDSRLGSELIALGKRYGAGEVPDEDRIADFYEFAVDRLAAMGIERYEISNFARPGFESLHNLKYWHRDPYFGFGADAHSFDGEWRWQNVETPSDYVARIEGGESPESDRTAADPASEHFFLGLRLREGVTDWEAQADAVDRLVRSGLLEIAGKRARLTPRGVMLSNEVFAEFVA